MIVMVSRYSGAPFSDAELRQFAPDEWRRRPDEFVRPVEVCKAGLCECVSPKPNSAKVASKRVLSLLGWEAAAGR